MRRRTKLALFALCAALLLLPAVLALLEELNEVEPEALTVAPAQTPWRVVDGRGTATVVLKNDGERPLEVTVWLAPLGEEAGWLSFAPETRRVTVAPRATERVAFDMLAKDGTKAQLGEAEMLVSWIEQGRRFTDRRLVVVAAEDARVEDPKDDALAMAAAGAAGAAAGGALAWLVRLDWRRLHGMAAAALLYSRISRGEALDNENRRKVMAAIELSPGIHFSELRRRTGLPNGALYHHLHILAESGHVTSERRHGRRVYAATGARMDRADAATPAERRILDLLPAEGLTLAQIAERLGITRQGVAYHVLNLEERGLLRKRMVEGSWRCFRA